MDPADWRNTWARGIDSMPGRLTSSGTDLAIDYDAGGVSTTGDPLTLGVDGDFAWKKSGRIAGEAYACGLDRDSVLWIRFEGVLPGLFWADVDGPGEIAFVLKLLARYRVELIDRTRAGSVEQSPREAGKSEAPAAPG